jgi:uncharacterized protein (DUF362 family)
MANIYIDRLKQGYSPVLLKGFEWLGLQARLKPGTRVAVKPNLTFPTYRPGVMTNPSLIEALVEVLLDYSCDVTIVESDSGGYNRFSIDEVFDATGITRLAKRYNVRLINLSHVPSLPINVGVGRRQLLVPMPAFLLESTDLLVTAPVPKMHLNTLVSLSVKNQWGIIQNPTDRLRLHPDFSEVIYAVNKALPEIISVVDGKYGLTRGGPMEGDPVELNWVLLSDDLFKADFLCCKLMGLDPLSIPYLNEIFHKEHINGLSSDRINQSIDVFIASPPFFLRRKWTDLPGLCAFHSRLIAYVAYRSIFSGFLHRLLYLFRKPFYDYGTHRR